jgi:hypothetical protein
MVIVVNGLAAKLGLKNPIQTRRKEKRINLGHLF